MFPSNGTGAMGRRGDAGGEGLHVGYVLGDALVSWLAFDVVVTTVWFVTVAPKGEGDVVATVKGDEGVDSFPGVGDVGGSAYKVVEAGCVGGCGWFDGEESMVVV